MNELAKTLVKEFQDKEYAHAYLEDFLCMELAAQLAALREQRGLSLEAIAEQADIDVELLKAIERAEAESIEIAQMQRLAEVFDVGLRVSFERVSDRIFTISHLSRKRLEIPPREKDLQQYNVNTESDGWKTVTMLPQCRTRGVSSKWVDAPNFSFQRCE